MFLEGMFWMRLIFDASSFTPWSVKCGEKRTQQRVRKARSLPSQVQRWSCGTLRGTCWLSEGRRLNRVGGEEAREFSGVSGKGWAIE
jgi:hypothetical protein